VEQSNCRISGLAIAPVPLANYSVDLDIPSGLGASFGEDVDTVVQDLLVTPVWTRSCGSLHVVLIALECATRSSSSRPDSGPRRRGLGGAKRLFTDPWLGLVLAVAAAGFAWQGLCAARPGHAGARALLVVMVSSGLFVIADPGGTIGAVGGLRTAQPSPPSLRARRGPERSSGFG